MSGAISWRFLRGRSGRCRRGGSRPRGGRVGTRGPWLGEEGVVAAPDDQGGRLVLAQPQLSWDGQAITVTMRRPGTASAVLLAQLAEAAATLLASPAIGLVRRCEGPGCRMLFLPAHPRRRWCSPATCGNRARVARYYQRHKELDTPAAQSAGPHRRPMPRSAQVCGPGAWAKRPVLPCPERLRAPRQLPRAAPACCGCPSGSMGGQCGLPDVAGDLRIQLAETGED
jgi:hypothetical protein